MPLPQPGKPATVRQSNAGISSLSLIYEVGGPTSGPRAKVISLEILAPSSMLRGDAIILRLVAYSPTQYVVFRRDTFRRKGALKTFGYPRQGAAMSDPSSVPDRGRSKAPTAPAMLWQPP